MGLHCRRVIVCSYGLKASVFKKPSSNIRSTSANLPNLRPMNREGLSTHAKSNLGVYSGTRSYMLRAKYSDSGNLHALTEGLVPGLLQESLL